MEEKERLDYQSYLLLQTEGIVSFLIELPKNINHKHDEISFKSHILLHDILKQSLVLKLNHLFSVAGKEEYSIFKICNLTLRNLEKETDQREELIKVKKKAAKLFDRLKLNKIRNDHVAHLKLYREKQSIDYNAVLELIEQGKRLIEILNLELFKRSTYWPPNEFSFNSIINDRKAKIELITEWRGLKKNNQDSLDIEALNRIIN